MRADFHSEGILAQTKLQRLQMFLRTFSPLLIVRKQIPSRLLNDRFLNSSLALKYWLLKSALSVGSFSVEKEGGQHLSQDCSPMTVSNHFL